MSQAKVDRYKEEKANRKQIMKREKIRRIAVNTAAAVAAAAIIGWLGYSSYVSGQANKEVERTSVAVDATAVTDYLDQLDAE